MTFIRHQHLRPVIGSLAHWARLTGIQRRYFARAIRAGHLGKPKRIGNKLVLKEAQILDWFDSLPDAALRTRTPNIEE
jgi:hypothetical protein